MPVTTCVPYAEPALDGVESSGSAYSPSEVGSTKRGTMDPQTQT